MTLNSSEHLSYIRQRYPYKFTSPARAFGQIHRGDRIFISTGCGEPQHLVHGLTAYARENPKAFFDTVILHSWTVGGAPYTEEDVRHQFRHDSVCMDCNTRQAVNECDADYTPIFLSQMPALIRSGRVPVHVAMVQVSPPDQNGFMSLGLSVDVTKAALEVARLVIAQVNEHMPRIHGDTFIHVEDVTFLVPHNEPLLEYHSPMEDDIAKRIGSYVARIVEDGDTIQVGPGSLPNAVVSCLTDKRDLGVHTDLLTDGIVSLMKANVINNRRKSHNRGKTVASFCMGSRDTYAYIHDNPSIRFLPTDYTNNPMNIARHENMTAINSAFEIDLTGQATACSVGDIFYRGIGGQADFMRGAVLSPNGKTILAMESTAENRTLSRIVPKLAEGAGVTLIRGDVHYVVTEFGIAYLHGKNIRERAMELISIAHPAFRTELVEKARDLRLIYRDQAFIPGVSETYPEDIETYRTTGTNLEVFLRPVKISDEPLLKEFFYSLSDESMYKRFASARTDMPHERLQEFVVINYAKEIVILAFLQGDEKQPELVGLGQYAINEGTHTAEVAFVVRDECQNQGIGTELCHYLTFLAKREGLLGFTAEVLEQNLAMLKLFYAMGFNIESTNEEGVYELKMMF